MQPVIPRGFRDVLFDEARERERVVGAISAVFSGWGYDPVETPVAEEYATLEAGAGGDVEQSAFRLFDLDGSLLALRPEMTVPIARVVASRLADSAGPHRIRYAADVFREHASLRGQARQFTQVGVELVGAHGATADAEVALLLVEALEAAGLESFLVGIGTAEVLRSLLARASGTQEWNEAAMQAVQGRNLVELDRLAARADLEPAIAAALREVPRIRGAAVALERARVLLDRCGCAEALAGVARTWEILEGLGVGDRIQLDFGIMRGFGYYTGLQLEAYAPGLGLPLAGGGRYDRLLGAFGHAAPAAGFALGLERVMIALAEQGRTPKLQPLDAVIGGADEAEALVGARRARAAGWRVRVAPGLTGVALVREADACQAAEALSAAGGRLLRVDRAGEPAGALDEPLPASPGTSWATRGGAR